MPNRVLRDWTESEVINKLTVYAERFFTRLIMKVDDYGCFKANEVLLKSALFPLKDDVRNADITRWVDECQTAGLIVVYEVDSKRYLQIKEFGQRKRQMKSKYPCPINDGQMTVNGRPEKKTENRIEKTEEVDNAFFELFKRSAPKFLSNDEIKQEIGKFRNKYPDSDPKKSGALVNAWVSRIKQPLVFDKKNPNHWI